MRISDRERKSLMRIRAILHSPKSNIDKHIVSWDAKHYVYLYRCPDGKWDVSIWTLRGNANKPKAHLNTNHVLGWVYWTLAKQQAKCH